MPQWPIRVKLIAGLSLVVGMMLTLMGGSMFGLHAFHRSNLMLVDQLRELGASKELLRVRRPARTPRDGDGPRNTRRWSCGSRTPQQALLRYYDELKKNTTRGNRADDGRDELGLAFEIDHDLTAILAELEPGQDGRADAAGDRRLPEPTPRDARRGRRVPGRRVGLDARIERLNHRVMELPDILHRDFYAVLVMSQAAVPGRAG